MDPTQRRKPFFSKRKINFSGKIIAGRYRYEKELGRGGMGEVHLVEDMETGQKLAMKCCTMSSYAKRFEREVLSWMRLTSHANLVTALYFDSIDGIPTLFTEYVEGTSLRDIIEESKEKKKDIPIEKVLDYAIQICQGMKHLHKHGIIHRDLKPSNILVANLENGTQQIKITDMGLSKLKDWVDPEIVDRGEIQETIPPDLTRTYDMLGTPQYMSPQQYAHSKGVGEETDIYAFGIILYEMLTQGKKPFDASSSQGWFYAHTYTRPKHVKTQVSSRFFPFVKKSRKMLYNLVMQCISKKAEERPQTFGEIEKKLRKIYKDLCSKEYKDTPVTQRLPTYQEINNQAVSLLEMGDEYVQEGWKKLQKLCSSSPQCLEAQLNYLLFQLKHGQCSLADFWQRAKKFLSSTKSQYKVIKVMVGGALERGSYLFQSLQLLDSIEEKRPSLVRLKAKWLYLSGKYLEAISLLEKLCKGEHFDEEDFYHWAGAIIYMALEVQKAKLCINRDKFSLEVHRNIKQKVWYILRKGEEKCGSSSWLERGKDVVIGAPTPVQDSFWHEYAAIPLSNKELYGVAVSSNQRFALLGGEEQKVILWDILNQTKTLSLEGHTDSITSVAISPEGELGASGSKDGTLRIWELQEGKEIACYSHNAPITSIALSLEKNFAISCGTDGVIRVWNIDGIRKPRFWHFFQKKQLYSFSVDNGKILSVDISLEGRYLLGGCEDGKVLVWNLQSPKAPSKHLPGELGVVSDVAISTNGRWAIATSFAPSSNVWLWDLKEKTEPLSFCGAKGGIQALAVAANGYWVFVACKEAIHIWDLKWKKNKVGILEGHEGRVNDLSASLQGDMLFSVSEDGSLRIWKNSFVWPLIREQKYLKVVPHKNSIIKN